MTKVNVLNIGEGTRTLNDVKGRPHNFPCGTLAEIDLPEEYIDMLKNSDRSRGNVFIIEDAQIVKELPAQFTEMLALLADMGSITAHDMIQRAGKLLGRNAMRLRPQQDEVRQRLKRIASAYAVRGFTDFDEIMKNAEATDDPEGRTPDAIAAQIAQDERQDRAINNYRQVARPNVPKHLRSQMADFEAARAARDEAELRSGDDSYEAAPRKVLGRVPNPNQQRHVPASTVPVEVTRNLATAAPGQLHNDGRPKTPDELEREMAAADAPDIVDAPPRRTVEQSEAPRARAPGRQERKRIEDPAPAARQARKTAPAKPVKGKGAKKAPAKGTSRKTR